MPVLLEDLDASSSKVLVQLHSHVHSGPGSDLGEGETCGDHVEDKRDPDSVTADAGLSEADIGVHGYSLEQPALVVSTPAGDRIATAPVTAMRRLESLPRGEPPALEDVIHGDLPDRCLDRSLRKRLGDVPRVPLKIETSVPTLNYVSVVPAVRERLLFVEGQSLARKLQLERVPICL